MDDFEDEDIQPRNPGTANNQERTGDRDLYFSWVLRQPASPSGQLRSCDFDTLPDAPPTVICNRCSLPVLWLEATRKDGFKATRYTEAIARKLGIPAYLVRHAGRWGLLNDGSDRQPSPKFEVVRLSDRKSMTYNERQFIEWLQRKFEAHFKDCGRNR